MTEADARAARNPRDLAIEETIDLLIQGRYLSVPDGSCPLTVKLKTLAKVLEERMLVQVKGIVDLSVISNEAVTETAEMMRAVREVDSRSQAIAAAAAEMVASVEEISRNANAASQDAGAAFDAASSARRAADEAVATMDSIAHSVAEAGDKVEGLANTSAQIGNIVDQIEAIAKQTNLLALNATIEAARAGEAGKGFAVVAVEVKNLASQTAKATVDIRARIDTVRHEMSAIVAAMHDSAEAVERGQRVIALTGDGISGVNDRIQQASRKIDEISNILSQQTEASGEVSQGISVIADMATQNVETIGKVINVMDQADVTIAALVADLVKMELTDLTIHVAKSDHMIWRKKLAEMLVGRARLNPDELSNHTNCRLGKWYGGVSDPSIRNHPAFAALESPHRDVHSHGITAARKYQSGDFDGALAEVRLVAEASVGVIRGLDALASRPRQARAALEP